MTKLFIPFLAGLFLCFASFGPVSGQVFFSEDFDGGIPSDWTLVKVVGGNGPFSNWVATTVGPQGDFATAPVASTTAANGWVMFDSDSDCNHPQGQDAWLISPAIDCSGKPVVSMQFETFYRSFNDRPAIMVGTDLGDLSTWTEFIVFPGVVTNQFGDLSNNGALNPQIIKLNLSSVAANEAQVYFAFRFHSSSTTGNGGNLTGCAYAWQVDDVILTEESLIPPHDMRVNSNFAAVAPNLFWPLSMAETFGFLADIQNIGTEAQTNVVLNVTIEDPDGAIAYDQSLDYGTIGADSLAENVPFADPGFLPTKPGFHEGTYTVIADSTDIDPDNNIFSFEFFMSDTLFSKEDGTEFVTRPGDGNWNPGELWSWAYGNYFYVPLAQNNIFSHVFFAIGNTADIEGEDILIRVYEWADNGDALATPAERNAVATIFYNVTGTEDGEIIARPITTFGGDPVALKDDTHYLVMVEYQASEEGTTMWMGQNRSVDYGAMVFRSELDMKPRYASFLGLGPDISVEDYNDVGFGYDRMPVVRFSFGQPSSVKELLQLKGNLSVFPNPANSEVNLSMDFDDIMKDVTIQLFDINGRLIDSRRMDNVAKQQVSFNTSQLVNGTYLFKVTTEKGVRSERFSVQR